MNKLYLSVATIAMTTLLTSSQLVFGISLSGKPDERVSIGDFDLFEVGIKLAKGQKISYSYDANSLLLFSVHKHIGSEVITYVTTEKRNYSGTFVAPEDGDYYLLWENLRFEPTELRYEISFPRYLHIIEYEEQSFDIEIISNSKVENLAFSAEEKKLSLNIDTPYLTPGFVDVSIPAELLGGEFSVEGNISEYSVQNGSISNIIVYTSPGNNDVIIYGSTAIPEFPFNVVFIMTAMLVMTLVILRFKNFYWKHGITQ